MKITYPVPAREVVGYRQVPVYRSYLEEETLLDYDFKAAKRAKGAAKTALIAGVAYIVMPVVLPLAVAADVVRHFASGFVAAVEEVAQAFAFVFIPQFKDVYATANAAIARTVREIVD